MSERVQSNETLNSDPRVTVEIDGFSNISTSERDQRSAPTEYNPSHDEESVPDTAYTYKECDGRFYSITHENGKEVVSTFVFDIQNDEQQAAFDLALTAGQSSEFKMIERMEYNGKITTLEVTQKFIIYDTPDGRYMTVESKSRPVPEEDEEPEDTKTGDNIDPTKSEESDQYDRETNLGNDEDRGYFGGESGKNIPEYELETTKPTTKADIDAEARTELTEEDNAREAVADALSETSNDPEPTTTDIEPRLDSGDGKVTQESFDSASAKVGDASEPISSNVSRVTGLSPKQTIEYIDDQKSAAASQDEGFMPEAALTRVPILASVDVSNFNRQGLGSSKLIQETHEIIPTAETKRESSELVEKPEHYMEIESEAIVPPIFTKEYVDHESDKLVADAHSPLELNDEPEVPTEISRPSAPTLIQFESELNPSAEAKEQSPITLEVREATVADKIIEPSKPIVQETNANLVEQVKKQPLAIQKAAEGEGEMIYSRQDTEKPAPDITNLAIVTPEKPEMMTNKNIETPTINLEGIAPLMHQPETIRPPESVINKDMESSAGSAQPAEIELTTNKTSLNQPNGSQRPLNSRSDTVEYAGSTKTNKAIKRTSTPESIRSQKEPIKSDAKPIQRYVTPFNESIASIKAAIESRPKSVTTPGENKYGPVLTYNLQQGIQATSHVTTEGDIVMTVPYIPSTRSRTREMATTMQIGDRIAR